MPSSPTRADLIASSLASSSSGADGYPRSLHWLAQRLSPPKTPPLCDFRYPLERVEFIPHPAESRRARSDERRELGVLCDSLVSTCILRAADALTASAKEFRVRRRARRWGQVDVCSSQRVSAWLVPITLQRRALERTRDRARLLLQVNEIQRPAAPLPPSVYINMSLNSRRPLGTIPQSPEEQRSNSARTSLDSELLPLLLQTRADPSSNPRAQSCMRCRPCSTRVSCLLYIGPASTLTRYQPAGLDKQSLAHCVKLLEDGTNPDALAVGLSACC